MLEFISRNMEEVTLDGKKVLKVKEGTGKKSPGKTKEKKGRQAHGKPPMKGHFQDERKNACMGGCRQVCSITN